MSPPEPAPGPSDAPTVTLIQRLKDGSIHPSTLTKEQRLACVEVLYVEGYPLSQIAQVVDKSEKTVKRNLAEIHAWNALTPSQELAKQLIGKIQLRSETHQARLMRLARGSEGSVSERAQAEYMAWQVLKESTVLMQSIGYLPQRAQHVLGDFVHRLDTDGGSELGVAATEEILKEIETVGQETGFDPQMAEQLKALRQRLEHAKLQQDAQRLLIQQQQQGPVESQEPSDGR